MKNKRQTNVKEHPRQLKSGRTKVKRHKRNLRTKKLDKNLTKSIESLQNEKREYSIGIDLDRSNNARYVEETGMIKRGTSTSKEKRATVSAPGEDVTIHTHPEHGTWSDHYNRPSGYDMYSMLYRSINNGDLDEAYVVGPGKFWYRYYFDATEKESEIWKSFRSYNAKTFDSEIEAKYRELHRDEKKIAHLDYKERQKYFSGQISNKEVDRLRVKRDKPKWVIEQFAIRRTFYRFGDYMHDIWGIKIERIKKEKGEMTLHYRPESNVMAEKR